MRFEPRRGGLLAFLMALVLMAAAIAPAAAARYEPIEVEVSTFTVNTSRFDPLAEDRLGIIIDVIGAGIVGCLDNNACTAAGLSEVVVHQELTATLDTASGRARGRIVIDVISAGLTTSFSGSVAGTVTRAVDPGRWDLAILARAQAGGGAQATFGLEGGLEHSASGTALLELSGRGLVSLADGT